MRNGAMKSRPWVCSLALTLGWPTAGRGEAGPAAGAPPRVVGAPGLAPRPVRRRGGAGGGYSPLSISSCV